MQKISERVLMWKPFFVILKEVQMCTPWLVLLCQSTGFKTKLSGWEEKKNLDFTKKIFKKNNRTSRKRWTEGESKRVVLGLLGWNIRKQKGKKKHEVEGVLTLGLEKARL